MNFTIHHAEHQSKRWDPWDPAPLNHLGAFVFGLSGWTCRLVASYPVCRVSVQTQLISDNTVTPVAHSSTSTKKTESKQRAENQALHAHSSFPHTISFLTAIFLHTTYYSSLCGKKMLLKMWKIVSLSVFF